jgi:hypothetical protein
MTYATSASALLVTVEGLYGSLDLELPGDAALDTLIPLLIRHPAIARTGDPAAIGDWTIGLKGGQRFDSANTLFDYGVLEGSILQLQPTDRWTEPEPEIQEDLTLPNENKLLVLKNSSRLFSSLFKKSGSK